MFVLDRPRICVRLLQICCGRSPRHRTIYLYLDIAKLEHAPLGLLSKLCRMFYLCHRIMTFRLKYLISGIDMHFKLSFHIKLMAGKCGIVCSIPVDDGVKDQGLSMSQIFLLIVQESLLILLNREHGKLL